MPPRITHAVIAVILSCAAPASAADIPMHVETWAGYHYGGVNEGVSSPPSTMRKWVTYLDGGWPFNRDVCDVPGHPCKTVDYLNASNEYFGTCGWSEAVAYGKLMQQGTLAESAWLHARQPYTYATRIFNNRSARCTAASPNTGLFINKKSISGGGNALAFFNAFARKKYGNRWPDFLMNDDINIFNNMWPTGLPAYEYRSWIDVLNAQAAFLGGQVNSSGAPQPTFFNGCSSNPSAVTGVSLIKMRPNIVGCITENNTSEATLRNGRVIYSLDNCARVTLSANGGIFVNGPSDDGMKARRRSMAFNMLCYIPGREVFWEEAAFGSKYVNVFPEEGIYPTSPLQSMSMPGACPDETIARDGPGNTGSGSNPCAAHGHNDLLAGGTHNILRREFARCYNQGAAIGRCAVLWNLGDNRVTVQASWLKQRYSRMMTMGGGTIDEGGKIRLSSAAPKNASIPAYDALFLVQ